MSASKFILLLFLAFGLKINAQSRIARFCSLSRPLQCWVFFHPFVAGRAERISKQVLDTLPFFVQRYHLSDPSGGSLDAFRHTYWMACLTKTIGWHKAYRLGLKYEKGNKIDFRKGRYEEGAPPDEASMIMDMWNNSVGISMCRYDPCPKDSLAELVVAAIRRGDCMVISKNTEGNSLDRFGHVIANENWQGLWKNDRFVVKSH